MFSRLKNLKEKSKFGDIKLHRSLFPNLKSTQLIDVYSKPGLLNRTRLVFGIIKPWEPLSRQLAG